MSPASLNTLRETRRIWRAAHACVAKERGAGGERLAGWWAPDPGLSPSALRDAVETALREARVVKPGERISVQRIALFGRDVLVKSYALCGAPMRLRYCGRMSRGRRAYLAGATLRALGLPGPDPLGFLEERRQGCPLRSLVLMAWVPEAVTVRQWIKPRLHLEPEPVRAQVAGELAELLLDLYRRGVCHGDTKAANILVRDPENPSTRSYCWIDLDCMRFGWPLLRRDVLRNLAQLNGSVGRRLPEEDRIRFLRLLARELPWLAHPRVAETVRSLTHRRLLRELHDGVTP